MEVIPTGPIVDSSPLSLSHKKFILVVILIVYCFCLVDMILFIVNMCLLNISLGSKICRGEVQV